MKQHHQNTHHQCPELESEVPATAIDGMARRAAMEAQGGLRDSPAEVPSSGKNASRAVHRMIHRLGFNWRIPVSEMVYTFGTQELRLPYLSPLKSYKFLISNYPELVFGGFSQDKDIQRLLKSFWAEYRNVHPGHVVFQDQPDGNDALSLTVPLIFYGDEGRGRRRGNTALMTLETIFGLSTAENVRKGNHCFKCACCPDDRLLQRYPCGEDHPANPHYAAHASHNFKEHVFLSRVPMFLLPCALYKEHPDLLCFMVRKITMELRSLYYEGLTIRGKTWTIALLGMKGDAKWLAEMGSLTRFYGKKGRKRSLAMCHECYAGLERYPYEDVSSIPRWTETLYRSRPWHQDFQPCFIQLPFDRLQPERFLRRDLMHITKLGLYRHHIGSTIATLVKWNFFRWPDRGIKNDIPTQLERAYGQFRLWCTTFQKTAALRSFSRALLNWKSASTYPWANVKASDAVLLNQWIQEALLPAAIRESTDPKQQSMLLVMKGISESMSRFSQLLFHHQLLAHRRCCVAMLGEGKQILNGYAWLAHEINPLCGWAMVPKVHMFRHVLHDAELFLQQTAGVDSQQKLFLSPLAFSNECNEDMIGKCCRLARRVDARSMQRRVLQLWLVKAKILHERWKKKTGFNHETNRQT